MRNKYKCAFVSFIKLVNCREGGKVWAWAEYNVTSDSEVQSWFLLKI